MKKKIIPLFFFILSILIIIFSLLLLKKSNLLLLILTGTVINSIIFFLILKKVDLNNTNISLMSDNNLKNRLSNFINELSATSINPSLLEETYVKSIKLFESLILDTATNAIIEKHFLSILQTEISRSLRYKKIFSLLMIKIFNEEEFSGDMNTMLKKIVLSAKNFLRDIDIVGKYKEKRLLILLPETGIKGANIVASRIIENSKKIYDITGKPVSIHLSIGISTFPYNGKNIETLLTIAEKNISNADLLGGDQIIFHVE